jgi:hypothetical protein
MTLAFLSLSTLQQDFLNKDQINPAMEWSKLNVTTAWKAATIILGCHYCHYPKPSPPGEEETSTKDKPSLLQPPKSNTNAVNLVNLLEAKIPEPPKHERLPHVFWPAKATPLS